MGSSDAVPHSLRMLFFVSGIPMLASFKQLLFIDSLEKSKFNFLAQVEACRGRTITPDFFSPPGFE